MGHGRLFPIVNLRLSQKVTEPFRIRKYDKIFTLINPLGLKWVGHGSFQRGKQITFGKNSYVRRKI